MKKIWELDFYSRPNFFKHNKKLWEVLICETPMYSNKSFNDCFKFSQLCPSSTVNSIWLRQAIEKAMKKAGVLEPLTKELYSLVLPFISSDFVVNTSCRV